MKQIKASTDKHYRIAAHHAILYSKLSTLVRFNHVVYAFGRKISRGNEFAYLNVMHHSQSLSLYLFDNNQIKFITLDI
jgi:hypothetical protein